MTCRSMLERPAPTDASNPLGGSYITFLAISSMVPQGRHVECTIRLIVTRTWSARRSPGHELAERTVRFPLLSLVP